MTRSGDVPLLARSSAVDVGGDAYAAAVAALDAGDGLAVLAAVATATAELDVIARQGVALALAQGARWDDIAAALGLASRQAAWHRYRTTIPSTTTPTKGQA